MEKAGELTVEINMNVSDETIAACVAVLNMHLKNGTSEAFVERDENGICQIAIYNKTTTEK